jgi:LysR family transcriptional regulator, mexEF-oprN operon transcriptional activator
MTMNLNNLDFNLLRVLDVLITERNVTRSAEVLRRSQPAVSNALRRLRVLLGDDLLVRGPQGLALTPRAEAIRQPLREAIEQIEKCLGKEQGFNPAHASGTLRVSAPDRLSLAIVPALFDRLQKFAPNMSLHVVTADRKRAIDLLEEDQTDVALAWCDEKPHYLNAESLYDEKLFCVFRRGHPLATSRKHSDIAAVLSFPHLVVSATGARTAIFDELLARHSLSRNPLVSVSNFTAVPHLLSRSDMVGVFTELASDVFVKSFGLLKRPVPLNIGTITTSMVWHMRHDKDEKHVWLRRQIKAIYRDL